MVVGVVALASAVAAVFYLVSAPREGSGRRSLGSWKKYVPFQSLKIIIVAWQILTQVRQNREVSLLNKRVGLLRNDRTNATLFRLIRD